MKKAYQEALKCVPLCGRCHREGFAYPHSRSSAAGGSEAVRSDRERLLDILEAIKKIEKRAPNDRQSLEADELSGCPRIT